MNTIKFQTVSGYIKNKAAKNQFSLDTASKLANGEISLRDNTEYVRKEVSASPSGTIKLVDSNTSRLPGISTFDKNRLEKSVNHVVTSLRIAYANDAASGKEAAVKYSNDHTSMPAGLRSANIIISQDGKMIAKLPVMDFVIPANQGDTAYVDLAALALIREEVPFSIDLEFPDGVSLGADKHYVEVSLKGMATFLR